MTKGEGVTDEADIGSPVEIHILSKPDIVRPHRCVEFISSIPLRVAWLDLEKQPAIAGAIKVQTGLARGVGEGIACRPKLQGQKGEHFEPARSQDQSHEQNEDALHRDTLPLRPARYFDFITGR